LELSFVVEGRRVTTRTVSVRRWLPTRHALWLAPLAVLVAALLVWLGLRLFAPNDSPMAVPVPEGPAATEDATAVADQGAGRAVDGAAGPAADRAEEEPPAPDVEAVSREWTVYFRPDDPTLTETTMTRLGDIIDTIRDLTGDERGIAELRLVGHCALAGTEAGRVELSQARAGNVWRFLRQNGFGQPDELTVTGVGGQQPVTRDEEQQHLNRRVEISVQLEPRS
jgi:outer membrane protein OmpA-like peptidoglycan-associated protein